MTYNPKLIKGSNHRDLESLHPKVALKAKLFLEDINVYLKEQALEARIISTLRTFEEQEKLYNQGRTTTGKIVTNAKAGDSIHNWGCAFDIGLFDGGKYNTSKCIPFYKKLGELGIYKKYAFFWGGNFQSITDYPHYQYTGQLSNNDFLKKAKAGESLDKLLGDYEYDTFEELLRKKGELL